MLGQKIHRIIYFVSSLLLVAALSTSEVAMSITSLALCANWLLEGGFKAKFQRLKQRPEAWTILGLFLLYVLAMLWTTDVSNGLKELRLRLPFFGLPLVFSTIPAFSRIQVRWVLRTFIAAVLTSTLISFGVYLEWIPTSRDITDIRSISIFISHIRLSLMICFSLAAGIYAVLKWKDPWWVYAISFLWLIYFLYLIQSATALVVLFFMLLFGLYLIWSKIQHRVFKYALVTGGFIFAIAAVWLVYSEGRSYFSIRDHHCNALCDATSRGNPYYHIPDNYHLENGNYIWRNICYPEMEEGWAERSTYNFDGMDDRKQYLRATLVRYLTSKSLCKDYEGVMALTDEDIRQIERGNASSVIEPNGIRKRLREIFWEFDAYQNGANPSGNSVTMRFEFWRASVALIRNHLLFGVGTGDARIALNKTYRELESPLSEKYQLGAHNEYLSVAIKLGILGLSLFLFSLFYPLSMKRHRHSVLYLLFFVLVMVAFTAENMLETQPGVTFFAFFNSFFLFQFNRSE